MPLIRLTGSYDLTVLAATGDDVHRAMVACLNVPADDIFRVLDSKPEHAVVADQGYLGIERRRPVFVEVTLRAGRTDDAKQSFYAMVASSVAERNAIRIEDLLIVLSENSPLDWSFGNGIAQYAPAKT